MGENAGVETPIGPLWEADPEEWMYTVRVNLGGIFLCATRSYRA
jgi:NAD(P)-dependent dehydrogenase (short-subunit alcohol dehydrogenase family)